MAVLRRGFFQPVQADVLGSAAVAAGSFDPLATSGVSFGEFGGNAPDTVVAWGIRSLRGCQDVDLSAGLKIYLSYLQLFVDAKKGGGGKSQNSFCEIQNLKKESSLRASGF